MTRQVLVDTDVVSRYWKRTLPMPVEILLVGELFMSFVTYGELRQWVMRRQWGERQIASLFRFVSERFEVLHGDKEVADMWGRISAEATQKGRPLPQNDSWIAATCLAWDLPLLTLNRKDYERIPGLQLPGPS